MEKGISRQDLIVEALVPRAYRQAVGTTASTTNGTKTCRANAAFGSLICVHLRNLWMARISLLWFRLGRARFSVVKKKIVLSVLGSVRFIALLR